MCPNSCVYNHVVKGTYIVSRETCVNSETIGVQLRPKQSAVYRYVIYTLKVARQKVTTLQTGRRMM
jgi:hypothetical protein